MKTCPLDRSQNSFLVCIQNLPRIHPDSLQRSDGEEEEDGSLTLSPVGHDSSPDSNLPDWEGLTLPLPVTFEPEGEDGVSVSLGDLVRHMHPYCMAICVENEEGEQILPEGGILLEVVDQSENGEPILAIPDMDPPVPLPCGELSSQNEQKLANEAENMASDSLEHIVVDDEDETFGVAPAKVAAPATSAACANLKDEMITKRQKEEIKEKSSSSSRKKKKKCKQQQPHKPTEGRTLRSGTVRNTVQESLKRPERKSVKEDKKDKPPMVPPSSVLKPSPRQTKTQTGITTTALLPEANLKVALSVSPDQETAQEKVRLEGRQLSRSPTVVSSQQPDEMPEHTAPAPEKLEDSSAAPSAVLPPVPSETPAAASSLLAPPVSEALPPVAPSVPELKPKSLSLAEYRQLRQQKKPAPVENQDNSNSSKWPSLPELPKELPPIPCLPDPSPKDPRRPMSQATKKEVVEVRPAWQPRGPCAPPTPEALLVPPAYMVSSSSRGSAATSVPKPQPTLEPSKPSLPQTPQAPVPNSVMSSTTPPHTSAVPCVPQGSGSTASLKPENHSASPAGGKCSPALSGKVESDEKPPSQSLELAKTTTEAIKPIPTPVPAPSASQKTPTVVMNAPEVNVPTVNNNNKYYLSNGKASKASDTGVVSAAQPSDSQCLKTEPDMLETKGNPTTGVKPQRPKSPTQELIESFTSEIGEF